MFQNYHLVKKELRNFSTNFNKIYNNSNFHGKRIANLTISLFITNSSLISKKFNTLCVALILKDMSDMLNKASLITALFWSFYFQRIRLTLPFSLYNMSFYNDSTYNDDSL